MRLTARFQLSRTVATALFLMVLLMCTAAGAAMTYYVAPSGGDDASDGSSGSPWASFAHAMTELGPGDTLILKDGTYHETLDVTPSGTPGSPITIRAENDGQAIVDGEGSRVPCQVFGSWSGTIRRSDIVLEGLVCRNSDAHVVWAHHGDRITLRRMTAYNAGSGNVMVFNSAFSTDVLMEDCAGWGSGRKPFQLYANSGSILRRCWGRFESHDQTPYTVFSVYASSDSIVESCVGTMLQSLPPAPGGNFEVKGVVVHSNSDGRTNNNKIYGNVIHNVREYPFDIVSEHFTVSGNHFANNVGIVDNPLNPGYGHFSQSAGNSLLVENMTLVGFHGGSGFFFRVNPGGYEADFDPRATLRNSIFLSGDWGLRIHDATGIAVDNSYNDFWGMATAIYRDDATAGVGEVNVDPGFDVATYGKGAYLFVPPGSPLKIAGEGGAQMGAEVLYQYEDGVVTSTALWPWPMEDRILAESGASVTWELGGGLWKTLSGVYSDLGTELRAFGFLDQYNPALGRHQIGTFSGTDVAVAVPFGTDPSSLVATFGITGESVNVSGVPQVSDVTANDFSLPVVYTVEASDFNTQDYTVTVTILPPICPQTLDPTGCVGFQLARLLVNEKRVGKEKLIVKWRKAEAGLTKAEFGDPESGTSTYGVCVYDDAGALVSDYEVERAGEFCAGRRCWRSISTRGFKYRDKLLEADGIDQIKVKGGDAGRGRADAKGKNDVKKGLAALPVGVAEALASTSFATIQLRIDDGVCLTAQLHTIKKQTSEQFTAMTP